METYAAQFAKTQDLRVIGEDKDMVGESPYQVVTSQCPPCTVCELSCARSASTLVLCTRGVPEGLVHLWRDLRQRPQRLQPMQSKLGIKTKRLPKKTKTGLGNHAGTWDDCASLLTAPGAAGICEKDSQDGSMMSTQSTGTHYPDVSKFHCKTILWYSSSAYQANH